MYNKNLYNKMINCECSFDELAEFSVNMSVKKDFDFNDSFNKYYNLDKILMAIEKYLNKTINAEYLTYWANVYNWILMASYFFNDNYSNSFKQLLRNSISWELDALSFFDSVNIKQDRINLNKFIVEFKVLDYLYNRINNFMIYYAFCKDEFGENQIKALFIDEKNKIFHVLETDNFIPEKNVGTKIEIDELKEKVLNLSKRKFKKMKLFFKKKS